MNLMKKAAVSRHTCSSLSAQQDLPVLLIHLSIHLSTHLSSYLSIYFSIFSHSYPSVCPVHLFLHVSIYPSISPSITTPVNKDAAWIDIVSNWPDCSLSCIQGLFIFRELIQALKTGNLIKWSPWFERVGFCVCVSVCVFLFKIGLWRAVAKWIMLKQIFIPLGYCPVFDSIKPSAFRAITNKAVILVGKQRKAIITKELMKRLIKLVLIIISGQNQNWQLWPQQKTEISISLEKPDRCISTCSLNFIIFVCLF